MASSSEKVIPGVADLTKASDQALATFVRWYEHFEDSTSTANDLAQRDRDYYDGVQWSEEEQKELRKRGQPIVTINRIFRKVNFILGSEIRTRVDPEAYPRTAAHVDDASAATDALRYVCDAEDFDAIRSEFFENLIVEGYGGVVIETELAGSREEPQVDVKLRYAPWHQLWYDVHSKKRDFTDARYKGIWLWMDWEDAVARYPDTADKLAESWLSEYSDTERSGDRPREWVDKERRRVRVCECYYRVGDEWYVTHFTRSGFLVAPVKVPYVDDAGRSLCPLEMGSALIDKKNNRYGIVRHMVSPQDEVNKRRSKSLHLLNTRQLMAERGALLDPQKARIELAKPDGYIEVEAGALQSGGVQIQQTQDLAMGQLQLLAEAKAEIDGVGPSAEIVNSDSRVRSGRAEIARQQAASMELERIMESMRHWQHRVFQQVWWRIRQTWTFEKWIRVRDDKERKGFRFVGLNRRMTRAQRVQELVKAGAPFGSALEQAGVPDGSALLQMAVQQFAGQAQQMGMQAPPQALEQQALLGILQMPQMQEAVTFNDVSQLAVDIILSTSPDTTVIEQEEFDRIAAVLPSVAQAAPHLTLELVRMLIQASQLPEKKTLLEMLDKPQTSPEQAQIQQQQLALAIEKMQAEIHKLHAAANRDEVEAQATAQKTGAEIAATQASAMKSAAEAGEKVGGLQAGAMALMR